MFFPKSMSNLGRLTVSSEIINVENDKLLDKSVVIGIIRKREWFTKGNVRFMELSRSIVIFNVRVCGQ